MGVRGEALWHPSERVFQATILEHAYLHGWQVYYVPDSRRSPAGFPDLTLWRRLRLLFLELKTERGSLSLSQWCCLDQLCRAGALAVCVRPRDLDWLIELLRSW